MLLLFHQSLWSNPLISPNFSSLKPFNSSTMMMLVSCSNCHTQLQLPPGAQSIRCAICQAITHLADPRVAPPPPHHTGGHPPPSALSYVPPQPSPYNHAPPGPPPSAHGRKKAVIVGISYKFSRHELKGCINDAKCMKYLLINKFRFPESSIIMLTGKSVNSFLNLYTCLNSFSIWNCYNSWLLNWGAAIILLLLRLSLELCY